jgi:hypothetical protein
VLFVARVYCAAELSSVPAPLVLFLEPGHHAKQLHVRHPRARQRSLGLPWLGWRRHGLVVGARNVPAGTSQPPCGLPASCGCVAACCCSCRVLQFETPARPMRRSFQREGYGGVSYPYRVQNLLDRAVVFEYVYTGELLATPMRLAPLPYAAHDVKHEVRFIRGSIGVLNRPSPLCASQLVPTVSSSTQLDSLQMLPRLTPNPLPHTTHVRRMVVDLHYY